MGKKSSIPIDVLNSIQIDYKRNLKPQEIAVKYGLTAKRISDLAHRNGWVKEKHENNAKINEKIRKKLELNYDEQVAKIKADGRIIALNTLVEVMSDETAKKSDRVNAANGFLRVTGDLTQTQNITGSIQQNTKYVLPEEWQDVNKHIDDFINN